MTIPSRGSAPTPPDLPERLKRQGIVKIVYNSTSIFRPFDKMLSLLDLGIMYLNETNVPIKPGKTLDEILGSKRRGAAAGVDPSIPLAVAGLVVLALGVALRLAEPARRRSAELNAS